MVDMFVRKGSSSGDPSRITQDRSLRVIWLGSQWEESILMHMSTIRFSFYAMVFIKFMYINNILMKTRLTFVLYYMLQYELLCVPTIWSVFYQWVWISSGSGYENPMGQTPCCIMWSTHNHGIMTYTNIMSLSC